MAQPARRPPGVPLININHSLVQQRLGIALALALGYGAERTAWRLQGLDPVEAEQTLGGSSWRESREETFQHGLLPYTSRRYASPSRTSRPAVGPAKWVPMISVGVSA